MGKIADAIRGIALPFETRGTLLMLDKHMAATERQLANLQLSAHRKLDPGLKDSQVEMLRVIAAGGETVLVDNENVHFKKHQQHGGAMLLSQWIGDLVERGLIETITRGTTPPCFQITAKGRVFLGETISPDNA